MNSLYNVWCTSFHVRFFITVIIEKILICNVIIINTTIYFMKQYKSKDTHVSNVLIKFHFDVTLHLIINKYTIDFSHQYCSFVCSN